MEALEAPPLTGRRATWAIMRDRYQKHLCVPNFTPDGWWECDVFEVTKAGFYREYEVKLTRADFFCDARKRKSVSPRGYPFGMRTFETKHELLASGSTRGPTRFWYVTPAGLIRPEELPAWSGLIELRRGGSARSHHRWFTQLVKNGPPIHRGGCEQKIIDRAKGVCYWRMHSLLSRLDGRR